MEPGGCAAAGPSAVYHRNSYTSVAVPPTQSAYHHHRNNPYAYHHRFSGAAAAAGYHHQHLVSAASLSATATVYDNCTASSTLSSPPPLQMPPVASYCMQQQQQQQQQLLNNNNNNNNMPSPPPAIPILYNQQHHHKIANNNIPVSPPAASAAYHQAAAVPPQQYHDCYGVPAYPSVDEMAPQQQQQQQYHVQQPAQPPPPTILQPQQHQLMSPPETPPQYMHLHNDDYSMSSSDFNKSSRAQRNLAEKQRRDKLNKYINELSTLVPLVSSSPKKLDKTSVLRLSATWLRLNQMLTAFKEQREKLPNYLNSVNLCELLMDDRDIYLLVTSTGKIVFVSHTVENILGHSQRDLMGHSLLNITCPEDHDELRNNLKYTMDDQQPSNNMVAATQDQVDGVVSMPEGKRNRRFNIQRRSFYMRLLKRAVSRGEQPEYELVHVVGTLMIPNKAKATKDAVLSGNDIVLNAVVRLYNERRVTEVSMLEATREEYITRHHIDGRIIYVDHRISVVSGFMPSEVSGKLAFTFMHKDDVRWVMIALRQMYFKGESYGSSCYRLMSKNGEFVYMKTYGYLELNSNEDSIESFICVNTLVSPEEGKKEIIKMREKFTPLIRNRTEPGIAAISGDQSMEADSTTSLEHASTEDPKTLDIVVEQMIANIPAPAIDNVKETAQNMGPLPDSQFIKVAMLSKSLPPVSKSPNMPKIDKRSSLSPQPIAVKPPTQDRPSVLRVAPPMARQPVVVYSPQADEASAEKDREYYERRGEILVHSKRQNDMELPETATKKAKIVPDSPVESPACSLQDSSCQSDYQLNPNDFVSLDGLSTFDDTPSQFDTHSVDEHDIDLDPLTDDNIMPGLSHISFQQILTDNNGKPVNSLYLQSEKFSASLQYDPNGLYNDETLSDINHIPLMQVLKQEGDIENDMLEKEQRNLNINIERQGVQIHNIQSDLESLPSRADAHFLTTNFSTLKTEHEKQKQMLRSLKEGRQNILNSPVGFQPNIGV
ncbi:neuronal PAS domain-containing protein 2-like [Adelges cooleyi]|uniref:neuronal PAS domain-containing protein 2-like n=1 Tax=Adelges cooleyi TaxID=133065 RepID=UPI00217F88CE|nr:neuronal PAS domain-containing protein 2-like [Adelges cooleyi]